MVNYLSKIGRRVAFETQKALLSNELYNWHVFTRQLNRDLWRKVAPHYPIIEEHSDTTTTATAKGTKTVVAMHNGWVEGGGLADRLRGIVSTYLLCKELCLPFRLHFVQPFPLESFLVPNTYDWRIRPSDLRYTQPYTTPIAFEVGNDTPFQARKQKAWLKQQIAHAPGKQVHIYTNAMFAYHEGYGEAFRELFKPSEPLQAAIEEQRQALGFRYVSVSTRFMGALGDFKDTVKISPLPPDKQQQLIHTCLQQIEHIHHQHPTLKVLVNSDSNTFLRHAESLPYVYTIPGTIIHLDVTEQPTASLYKTYEKTLLDFFMIANAQCIYRLHTRWMRPSGFPYAASLVYGRPFQHLKFPLA